MGGVASTGPKVEQVEGVAERAERLHGAWSMEHGVWMGKVELVQGQVGRGVWMGGVKRV